ncbi:MAG: hypothetical protein AAGJ35_03530, partial [Myxococcota bacterium]
GLNERVEKRPRQISALARAFPGRSTRALKWAAILLVVCGIVLACFWGGVRWQQQLPVAQCLHHAKQIQNLWYAERLDALQQVFRDAHLPQGDLIWKRVQTALRKYALNWKLTYTQVCKNVYQHQEHSDALGQQMRSCLYVRYEQYKQLLAMLLQDKSPLLKEAVRVVHALPRLELCTRTDVASMQHVLELNSAQKKKRREAYASLFALQLLWHARKTLLVQGKLQRLREDIRKASDIGWKAHASLFLFRVTKNQEDAECTLRFGLSSGQWSVVARVWMLGSEVALDDAFREGRTPNRKTIRRALRDTRYAAATLQQLPALEHLHITLWKQQAVLLAAQGKQIKAQVKLEKALKLTEEKGWVLAKMDTLECLTAVSSPKRRQARLSELLKAHTEYWGKQHVERTRLWVRLVQVFMRFGDVQQAQTFATQAMAFQNQLSPLTQLTLVRHRARALHALGELQRAKQDLQRALRLLRGLSTVKPAWKSMQTAHLLLLLGQIEFQQQHLDAAKPHYARAQALVRALRSEPGTQATDGLTRLHAYLAAAQAELWWAQNKPREAKKRLEDARFLFRKIPVARRDIGSVSAYWQTSFALLQRQRKWQESAILLKQWSKATARWSKQSSVPRSIWRKRSLLMLRFSRAMQTWRNPQTRQRAREEARAAYVAFRFLYRVFPQDTLRMQNELKKIRK